MLDYRSVAHLYLHILTESTNDPWHLGSWKPAQDINHLNGQALWPDWYSSLVFL